MFQVRCCVYIVFSFIAVSVAIAIRRLSTHVGKGETGLKLRLASTKAAKCEEKQETML